MKTLFLLLTLSASAAFAQVCNPATQYDMVDWMTLDGETLHYMGAVAPGNPAYYFKDWTNRAWYVMKGSAGYPWDVNFFDATSTGYVYQWATESVWGDPSTYKAFDAHTTMPWAHRCVPVGAVGAKLDSISLATSPYHFYDTGCVQRPQQFNLGFVVNETWHNGPVTLGGNLPDGLDTLSLVYRYSCSSSYDNCSYKEIFDYAQKYGLVRWTYFVLSNGVYVQQNQTVHNSLNSMAGSVIPVHPCW